jgi:ABC-type sugar transport system ATPase subunit
MPSLGANGAGKSTRKVLTGVISSDQGLIELNGKPIKFFSPDEARKNGVAPVFQDPALNTRHIHSKKFEY